jgi:hypothetical protein
MKAKKAIKKIVALGMGATLLGATLLGASAANLNEYPNMFISDDGHFNGLIVVGANAASIDTIGALDVALALQSAAVKETVVCTDEGTTSDSLVLDDGLQIQKTNSYLNYGNDTKSIVEKVTVADLPSLLAKGRYDNEDYKQEILLSDQVSFVFGQDKRYAPEAGDYLYFKTNQNAYEYMLQFDSAITFDTKEDLEGTTIQIQGQTYTISSVRLNHTTNGAIEKMTLMVGETLVWLTQGESITKTLNGKEYKVEVINVDNNGEKCGLLIDGSSEWIDKNAQKTVGGLTVGVTDVIPVYSDDRKGVCKVNLGSSKLILTHDDEVDVDGKKIDGSTVYLTSDATDPVINKWSGIRIKYQPSEDTYLSFEEEMKDPIFENFKFVFGGIDATYEEMEFSVSGDEDASVSFRNIENKEIVIPVYYYADATDHHLIMADRSEDIDRRVYTDDVKCDASGVTPQNARACEGAKWLLTQSNDLAALIEVTKISKSSNDKVEVNLKDLTAGGTAKVELDTDNTYKTVNLPGFGNVDVKANNVTWNVSENRDITLQADATADIKTYNGGILAQTGGGTSVGTLATPITLPFTLKENSKGLVTENTMTVTFGVADASTTDGEIKIATPTNASALHKENILFSESDKDNKYYITNYGSKLLYDSKDKDDLKVWHPVRETRGIAYVAPAGAAATTVGGIGSNCQVMEKQNPIPSTVNKLDTDLGSTASAIKTAIGQNNIITIGGPCANAVSAALLDVEDPEKCTEGFEPGQAIIKLFENNNKFAMLIAGYSGEDTRLATKYVHAGKLKNLEDGKSAVIEGTSEADSAGRIVQ